jgi:RimJ/RimL family protein N-acetyltransferase
MTTEQIALTIRAATIDDAQKLFNWRNDEDTRRFFLNPGPVTWEDHIAWLTKTVGGAVPGRTLCIVEAADGETVGMVRGDKTNEGIELSYTVAPEMRGKGHAKRMVSQFVKEYFPNIPLIAKIQKDHRPSESVARALGLSPQEEERDSIGRTFVVWR